MILSLSSSLLSSALLGSAAAQSAAASSGRGYSSAALTSTFPSYPPGIIIPSSSSVATFTTYPPGIIIPSSSSVATFTTYPPGIIIPSSSATTFPSYPPGIIFPSSSPSSAVKPSGSGSGTRPSSSASAVPTAYPASPLISEFWGAGLAGSQESLGYYCLNNPASTIIIGYVNQFGFNQSLSIALSGYSDYFPNSTLLNATSVGADIKLCQSLGRSVVLALGGPDGDYGISGVDDAINAAENIWNVFGGGSAPLRPFGDAVVDGFIFDIEDPVSALSKRDASTDYSSFLNALSTVSNSTVTIGAAVDPSNTALIETVNSAGLDSLTLLSYGTPSASDYATWLDAVQNSGNPNAVISVAVYGSPDGLTGGSSYTDPFTLADYYFSFLSTAGQFGTYSILDSSSAASNIIDGLPFDKLLAYLLEHGPLTTTTVTVTKSGNVYTSTEYGTVTVTSTSGSSGASATESTTGATATSSTTGPSVLTPTFTGPTTFTYGGETYTVTAATTLSILDCSCTDVLPTASGTTVTKPDTTETVHTTYFTTYCPEATTFTYGESTYTVVTPTTITITYCPETSSEGSATGTATGTATGKTGTTTGKTGTSTPSATATTITPIISPSSTSGIPVNGASKRAACVYGVLLAAGAGLLL